MNSFRVAASAGLLVLLAACGGGADGTAADGRGPAADAAPGAASGPSPRAGTDEAADPAAADDMLAVAERDGRFTTLLAAVEAAGLSDALRSGRYTLLAPTDDAFAGLPGGTVEQLLRPENREQLATVLQYHVLEEPIRSGDIGGMIEATTLAGDALVLEEVGERVLVGGEDGAVVTAPDIEASNGVVHVIDKVLIPPSG